MTNQPPEEELSTEPTEELHSCPYQGEIEDNYDDYCNCSPAQQHQCAMDI